MYGWMGKILRVNLSNLEIDYFPTQGYTDFCLGGRGIASRTYWETGAPEMGAFDLENRLIFMTDGMVASGYLVKKTEHGSAERETRTCVMRSNHVKIRQNGRFLPAKGSV